MAKTGDILEHPMTGEKIIIRKTSKDTGGEYLEADFILQPHGFVAAEHTHPRQEEQFKILEGKVKLRIGGVEKEVNSGDIVIIPPNTPHIWWNDSDQPVHTRVEVRPALRTEEFFETFFGLAQAGKVNKKTGLPSLFALALIMKEFEQEIRLSQPPVPIQRILFSILGSIGRLRGYKGRYSYPHTTS